MNLDNINFDMSFFDPDNIKNMYLGPGGVKDYFKKQENKISKTVTKPKNDDKFLISNIFRIENYEPFYESKNVKFPNIYVEQIYDKQSKTYKKCLVVKIPDQIKDKNTKEIVLDFNLQENKDIIVRCEDDDIRVILSDDLGILKATIEWEGDYQNRIFYTHIKRWYKLIEAFILGIKDYCELVYKQEDYYISDDEEEYTNTDEFDYDDYDDYSSSEEEEEENEIIEQNRFVNPIGKAKFF